MTDNDIIKALEHCTQHKCHECPRYYETPDDADICKTHLMRNALDLINCQKVAIEDGRKRNFVYFKRNKSLAEAVKILETRLCHAKAEAIKEFAKCLKNRMVVDVECGCDCADYVVDDLPEIINELVKEMVGEG